MTSTQQNGGIEDRLATDGLTSRSGMVQGGKENLMAGTGSLEARAVPIPVVVPAELGMKFVARFPVLGPRIQPAALAGASKVAIDQLRLGRLLLRRIGIRG
jgi:hypothetical protein